AVSSYRPPITNFMCAVQLRLLVYGKAYRILRVSGFMGHLRPDREQQPSHLRSTSARQALRPVSSQTRDSFCRTVISMQPRSSTDSVWDRKGCCALAVPVIRPVKKSSDCSPPSLSWPSHSQTFKSKPLLLASDPVGARPRPPDAVPRPE